MHDQQRPRPAGRGESPRPAVHGRRAESAVGGQTPEVVIGESGKLYLAAILALFSRFVVGWPVNVEIELPDTRATQAKKAGLLEPATLERMVREALLARRIEREYVGRLGRMSCRMLTERPCNPRTSCALATAAVSTSAATDIVTYLSLILVRPPLPELTTGNASTIV